LCLPHDRGDLPHDRVIREVRPGLPGVAPTMWPPPRRRHVLSWSFKSMPKGAPRTVVGTSLPSTDVRSTAAPEGNPDIEVRSAKDRVRPKDGVIGRQLVDS
jgi:hypothetical protein